MSSTRWSEEELQYLFKLITDEGYHPKECVDLVNGQFGNSRTFLSIKTKLNNAGISYKNNTKGSDESNWREEKTRDTWVINCKDSRIRNVNDAIKKAGVDMAIWEVDKVLVTGWDVTMKIRQGDYDKPFRSQNQKIGITLKRKVPVATEDAVANLLKRLENKSKKLSLIKHKKIHISKRNSLEICLMDIHYGMRCFPPAADSLYSPEICEILVEDTINEFINITSHYNIEEIVLPLGNDFFHVDGVFHTTTKGTGQPEADSYLNTFTTGEELAIKVIDTLKQIAPVKIYSIPGNHDRVSSFMLGRILQAYYKNDKNINIEADSSPYKAHRYGVNLWAYEHGNSVQAIRLAGIMANEWSKDFAETKFRSWHLGDQHRRGSAKPSMLAEQGVSIEYLPSIVASNEWSKIKGYTNQQRGSQAYLWNYETGPVGKFHVNIDKDTNKVLKSM